MTLFLDRGAAHISASLSSNLRQAHLAQVSFLGRHVCFAINVFICISVGLEIGFLDAQLRRD